jgi:hypothetical protein
MRFVVAISCAALLCAGAFAQHAPKAKGDARATFVAIYQRAEQMFHKKDVKGLYAGMTADFTETIMGRKLNKEESMKSLQQLMGMFQTLNCKFTLKSAEMKGATTVTKDSVHISGPSSQTDPKTHKRTKIDATRDETFTWVKLGGRWMLKSIVATNQKIMLNGKAMPMTGRA